jgi:AAA domain
MENRPTHATRAEVPQRAGIQSTLQRLESAPVVPWRVAVADFNAARQRVEDATCERARVDAALTELPAAVREEQRHRAAAATAERAVNQHATRADQLSTNLGTATTSRENILQRRRTHHQFKPRLLYVLLTRAGRRAYGNWADVDANLQAELTHIERTVGALAEQQAHANAAAADARSAADASQAAAHEADRRAKALTAQIDAARGRWNGFVPDSDWWKPDNIVPRELAAPWLDAEFNQARSDLFLAALRLHRSFLAQVPKQMRQSLHGAIDILKGEAPADLAPYKALAAWQALFFLVPIVSTTFASFERIFGNMGCEALGWLLIDEAGQATPQNAVGAIWRSRRVVVVGDPLQLEPVLTIPFRAQQAIRKDHGVAEEWLPAVTSVQKLADRLTPIGTTLHTGESPIWVGCPLRVHRRCDEPMFTIANLVAYQSRMIAAPVQRPPVALRPSAWVDITGHTVQGHWIREETNVLLSMLDCLAERGQDMAQVFVITPFRDIARQLSKLPGRYGERLRAGTIHTAQGKEADIVFLVLGGDPAKPGAKQWAANPNLINVAVSRARRRLYVIGDHRAWTQYPNLALVAQAPLQRLTAEQVIMDA